MNGEFQTVLECFSPRSLSIAAGLHDVIMSLCPSAVVQVNVRAKTLIYRRQAGENPFCVVEPHQAVVKVHFPKGHALEDPAQRLKGNGKIRRMILNAPAQVADEPVRRLIEEAARIACESRAPAVAHDAHG
jgi:hypothetical protein